jgi:cytochrome c-type biogenesis protein CcmH/NrfG
MLANKDEKALATIKELIPTVNREEFNSLVSQMMQVYTQRKDLKGIIKLLGDAIALDPVNQNFVLWLAQANVAAGDYNAAVFTINKLSTSNPEVVAQFNSELQTYLKSQQEKQAAEAPAPKTTKK